MIKIQQHPHIRHGHPKVTKEEDPDYLKKHSHLPNLERRYLVEQELLDLNLEVIEFPKYWLNQKDPMPLRIKCLTCGYIFQKKTKAALNTPFCPSCEKGRQFLGKQEKRRKILEAEMKKTLKYYNGQLLTPITGKKNEIGTFVCQYGHKFDIQLSRTQLKRRHQFRYGQWCPHCPIQTHYRKSEEVKEYQQLDPVYKTRPKSHLFQYKKLMRIALESGFYVKDKTWHGRSHQYTFVCICCGKIKQMTPQTLYKKNKYLHNEFSVIHPDELKEPICSDDCHEYWQEMKNSPGQIEYQDYKIKNDYKARRASNETQLPKYLSKYNQSPTLDKNEYIWNIDRVET